MKPDTKEILRRVDEFNAIEVGDTIANAGGSQKIYAVGMTTERQEKSISFLRDDILTSIDRDEYVLNNWVKVPKEILEI